MWKSFECELWKDTYSDTLQAKYNLLWYENPFQKYIAFEGQSGARNKTIYLVNLDAGKTEFRVGRGHDSDIRISEISVSRLHANLKIVNNELILNDCNSKFGTLALINKPVWLSQYSNIHLQLGRTLIQVSSNENNQGLGCCYKLTQDNTQNENEYKEYLSTNNFSHLKIPTDFWKLAKDNRKVSFRMTNDLNPDEETNPMASAESPSVRMAPKRTSFDIRKQSEPCPDMSLEID